MEALWGRTGAEAKDAAQKLGVSFHTSQVGSYLTFSQITEVFFESRHDHIVIRSRLILTNLPPVPPGG